MQNLLTKGSLNHLTHQLEKNTRTSTFVQKLQHAIELARDKQAIQTNVYLEDWCKWNAEFFRSLCLSVFRFSDFSRLSERVLLPDTLGVLTPKESFGFITDNSAKNIPTLHFDFHAHNDYDLSVANVMEALDAGVNGLHLTVNGMGERAGNAPLASVIAVINDFMPSLEINVQESSLNKVSKLVENFSGFRIPVNKPVVGANVFTQTAGIHADGDNKKNLYFNDLLPERFGRKRKYALGKTSGKANIQKNLQDLGLQLNDDDLKKVTQRIIELGDKKELVTQEDLPYIISDVLDSSSYEEKVVVESYVLTHASGLKPTTTVALKINGKTFEANANGDGQFDAFMNAVKKVYAAHTNKTLPKLIDYAVRIPPGSNSDALCETIITWQQGKKEFITRGLDSDQTVSAITATQKMLNILEM